MGCKPGWLGRDEGVREIMDPEALENMRLAMGDPLACRWMCGTKEECEAALGWLREAGGEGWIDETYAKHGTWVMRRNDGPAGKDHPARVPLRHAALVPQALAFLQRT